MDARSPSESETLMTQIVYPQDTNPMGVLNGGRIIEWMDTACAICAQQHSGLICVTAAIDAVTFKHPAKLGDIVTLRAKITRAFGSSMEIFAEAKAKRTKTKEEFLINSAYFTFVALDEKTETPARVCGITPDTAEEKRQFEGAMERKLARSGSFQKSEDSG